jgi:hypothetical protein
MYLKVGPDKVSGQAAQVRPFCFLAKEIQVG